MLYGDNNSIKYLKGHIDGKIKKNMAIVSAAIFDVWKWYETYLCRSKSFVAVCVTDTHEPISV